MHNRRAVLSIFLAWMWIVAGAGIALADQQYVVQEGDTLWSIAAAQDVEVEDLKAWNGLTTDALWIGQLLILQPVDTVEEIPAADSNADAGADSEIMYYTVRSGDTLASLSLKYGTSSLQIVLDNGLLSEDVEVGQIIKLRVPAGTVEAAAEAAGYGTYYVQTGDTLSEIAERHSMTTEELKNLNRMWMDEIFPGQPLKVMGESQNPMQVSRGGEMDRMPQQTVAEDTQAAQLIDYAMQYLGTPYVYGGTSPSGFDCSGFVQYVYRNALGISLNRTAADQAAQGTAVSQSELIPGDIVYFYYGNSIGHVGIYIGNNQFIHSSSPTSGGVIITSLSESYYSTRYGGARRIL